jgi:hypothetical protein
MVFSRARSERKPEDCAGHACWVLTELMLMLIAIRRVGKLYGTYILWHAPLEYGRNSSEDFYAYLARQL